MNTRIQTTLAVCLLLCVNEAIADKTGYMYPMRYVPGSIEYHPDGSSSFELGSVESNIWTTLGENSANVAIPGGRLEFYLTVKRNGVWRYELLPTSQGISANTWGEALMTTAPRMPTGRFTVSGDFDSYSCTRFGVLNNDKSIRVVPGASVVNIQASSCSGDRSGEAAAARILLYVGALDHICVWHNENGGGAWSLNDAGCRCDLCRK
jgi:hypothetical protein